MQWRVNELRCILLYELEIPGKVILSCESDVETTNLFCSFSDCF